MQTAIDHFPDTRAPSLRPVCADGPVGAPGAAAAGAAHGGPLLGVYLDEREFGIDIRRVLEVRAYESPTTIANVAACVLGVLNLRGVIVPVVDLRLWLGCRNAAPDRLTALVVLEIHGRVVAALVDAVSEIVEGAVGQAGPACAADAKPAPACTSGSGALRAGVAERELMPIDLDALMHSAGLGG